MLKTAIIEDDELDTCVLINHLKKLSSFEIEIVGTASNLEDGVRVIKKAQPDIVFLDINLPGRNGLEIYKEFQSPPFKIIFCTAYKQYALEALKKSADGYLIKPVDFIDLRETIQRISKKCIQEKKKLQLEEKYNALNVTDIKGENIILDTEDGFIMRNTRNIEYCYANHVYSIIVTNDQKEIVVSKPLKKLQKILPENQFFRTHRSYLVNIYFIRKFVHAKESYVLLKSGIKIPVSVRNTPYIEKDINKKLKS